MKIRTIPIPCERGHDVVYGLARGRKNEIYLAPSNEFFPGLCADVFRAILAEHELVTCPQVLQEVRRILRIKFGVPEQLIAEYLELTGQEAIMAESEDLPDLPIQDKDDVEIVAAAISVSTGVTSHA